MTLQTFFQNSYWKLLCNYFGLVSWWTAFECRKAFEETPPTCSLAALARAQGESLGSGTETKRPSSL